MNKHFLFQEGKWAGTGRATFSASSQVLPFTTSWVITGLGEERYRAVQKVDIANQGVQTNVFTVTLHPSGDFDLFLENEVLGVFSGTGICDAEQLAWEFAHHGSLEGMESYKKTNEEEYSFCAEYVGADDLGATIHGTILKLKLPES